MPVKGASIAVIGGSGLYEMEGLTDVDFVEIDTPFFGQAHASRGAGEQAGSEFCFECCERADDRRGRSWRRFYTRCIPIPLRGP